MVTVAAASGTRGPGSCWGGSKGLMPRRATAPRKPTDSSRRGRRRVWPSGAARTRCGRPTRRNGRPPPSPMPRAAPCPSSNARFRLPILWSAAAPAARAMPLFRRSSSTTLSGGSAGGATTTTRQRRGRARASSCEFCSTCITTYDLLTEELQTKQPRRGVVGRVAHHRRRVRGLLPVLGLLALAHALPGEDRDERPEAARF